MPVSDLDSICVARESRQSTRQSLYKEMVIKPKTN